MKTPSFTYKYNISVRSLPLPRLPIVPPQRDRTAEKHNVARVNCPGDAGALLYCYYRLYNRHNIIHNMDPDEGEMCYVVGVMPEAKLPTVYAC